MGRERENRARRRAKGKRNRRNAVAKRSFHEKRRRTDVLARSTSPADRFPICIFLDGPRRANKRRRSFPRTVVFPRRNGIGGGGPNLKCKRRCTCAGHGRLRVRCRIISRRAELEDRGNSSIVNPFFDDALGDPENGTVEMETRKCYVSTFRLMQMFRGWEGVGGANLALLGHLRHSG